MKVLLKDFIWAIKLNRWSLEFIGLWPKTNGISKRSIGSNVRAAFSFIMVTFFLAIPLVHALMRVWGDMTLMIDSLRIILHVLTIILKFVIMRWK